MNHRFTVVVSVSIVLSQLSVAAAQSRQDDNVKPRQPLQYGPIQPGIQPQLADRAVTPARVRAIESLRGVRRVRVRVDDSFKARWGVDTSFVKTDTEIHLRDVGVEVIPDKEAGGGLSLYVEVVVSKDDGKEGEVLINARLLEEPETAGDSAGTAAVKWETQLKAWWRGTGLVRELMLNAIEIAVRTFTEDYLAANRK